MQIPARHRPNQQVSDPQLESRPKNVLSQAEILDSLESLNKSRDARDRITYDSLWVHFQRHYSFAGKAAYWNARTYKEFKKALGGYRCWPPYRVATEQLALNTKN